MKYETIRVGGVPEHYNLPIHLAKENDLFENEGINFQWTEFPGGTGDMTKALRSNEMDACILLTEGILTDILLGNPSKIVSGYVKTPLTWGVHTQEINQLTHDEIFSKRFAISRKGSGSHLMPLVDALMREQTINSENFIEVSNLKGAIESLNEERTEVFYWEKYTTKPYLKEAKMKRIDDFISPWPCFLIAATDNFIENHANTLSKTLRIIQLAAADFMQRNDAVDMVNKRYLIDKKDAERWYHSTEWATDGWVSNKMLEGVHYVLKEAGLVDMKTTIDNVIWKRHKKD